MSYLEDTFRYFRAHCVPFHFQYCYNLQINHLSLTKVEYITVFIRNNAQPRLSTHLIGWKS